MQTFLVDTSSYTSTFYKLDMKRLGKQRIEGYQILRAINDPNYGWQNHPAVKMWRPYPKELLNYTLLSCTIWRDRGYNDTVEARLHEEFPDWSYSMDLSLPPFITDRLIETHRANLWLKAPSQYPAAWELFALDLPNLVCCPGRCNYYWPSHSKWG